MASPIDLTLHTYPVSTRDETVYSFTPTVQSRPSCTVIGRSKEDGQMDLNLYTAPCRIKEKKEMSKKEETMNEINNVIPENSNENDTIPLILPKKRKNGRIDNPPTTKKRRTSLINDSTSKERFQPASNLDQLMKEYTSITGKSTFPNTRIVEEYMRYSYLRSNKEVLWFYSEFIPTFVYLQNLFGSNQAINLTSVITGKSADDIKTNFSSVINNSKYEEVIEIKEKPPKNVKKKSIIPLRKCKSKEEWQTEKIKIDIVPGLLSWSDTFLALLKHTDLSNEANNNFQYEFFSEDWIRDRAKYDANPSNSFDKETFSKLIKRVETILPEDKQSVLPYFVSAISGRPLGKIRELITNYTIENIRKGAYKAENIHRFISESKKDVKSKIKPLLAQLSKKIPTSKEALNDEIKLLEFERDAMDARLYLAYKQESKELMKEFCGNSNGYFVVGGGKLPDFIWTEENVLGANVETQDDNEFLVGCFCKGDCASNISACTCIQEMQIDDRTDYYFHYTKEGLLKPDFGIGRVIYECNSRCTCDINCSNRVIQRPSGLNLIIFKDSRKGWGVRTLEFIQRGRFICEYTGEIISTEEAEVRGKEYDKKGISFLLDLDLEGSDCKYTIDATHYGNIARFMNHSCDPNAQNYSVFVDVLDISRPKICFFAIRDIHPGEEITFDYKYTQVTNSIRCYCLTAACRKYLV